MDDFLPIRGRRPKVAAAVLDRELTLEDVQGLAVQGDTKPPELVRIRESHHALARCLAGGCTPAEASAITGYSSSRISILQADPAFADLVELYRRDVNAVYLDMHSQLAGLTMDATLEMRERIRDNPESVAEETLVKIIEKGADRTGYGPATKQTTVNINVDVAKRIEAGRARAGLLALPGPKEPVV